MKKVLSLLLVLLFLVSCSPVSNKIEIAKYERIYEDVETYQNFTHKGDKIISVEVKHLIKYGDFLYKNKQEAKEFYKKHEINLSGVPGVEYKLEYLDKGVLQTVKFDYDKLDLKALEKKSGVKLPIGSFKQRSMKIMDKLLLKRDYKKIEE